VTTTPICLSGRNASSADLSALEDTDLRRVLETVPRGRTAADPDPAPGVDVATWALHVRYQRTQGSDDLDALVEEYADYARSLARRLRREGIPLEDLKQVALEALVAALQRFDCSRSIPFCAFATPTIIGALKRHYRDQGWSVRVPRRHHELAAAVRTAADRLTHANRRHPTVDEVAADLGIDAEDLLVHQAVIDSRRAASFDRTGDDGFPVLEIGVVDEHLDRAEERASVAEAMAHLDERERTVLHLYFYEELSQSQIAARFGVSQMQVSRWLARSLGRLRSRVSVTV